MKVLVTGGAGFIGSHTCELLLENKDQVIVIDNLSSGSGSIANLPGDVNFYKADILSVETKKIVERERPDYIIHTAAQTNVGISMKNPAHDANTNILGTLSLLELAKEYKVKKFVFSSSCSVYGKTGNYPITEDHPTLPISFYAQSKYIREQYIRFYHRLYELPYTILRYANVYGPRQSTTGEGGVISIFSHLFQKKESPTIYGTGEQTRDFVFVKDVAEANIAALKCGKNETFNIGTNHNTSINEVYCLLNKLANLELIPSYTHPREGDLHFSCLNNNKAKTLLNWNPTTTFIDGLSKTFADQRIQ